MSRRSAELFQVQSRCTYTATEQVHSSSCSFRVRRATECSRVKYSFLVFSLDFAPFDIIVPSAMQSLRESLFSMQFPQTLHGAFTAHLLMISPPLLRDLLCMEPALKLLPDISEEPFAALLNICVSLSEIAAVPRVGDVISPACE